MSGLVKSIAMESLTPEVTSANYVPLPDPRKAQWMQRHIRNFEFILALEGIFEFMNHENNETVIQQPGEIITIIPGEFHSYRLASGRKKGFFSCVHVNMAGNSRNTELQPRIRRLTRLSPDSPLITLFKSLNFEFAKCGKYKIENIIMKEILLHLAELWNSPPSDKQGLLLRKMTAFLDAHLKLHPSRNDLAREFNLSPQRINGIFKKELNLSPVEYVHKQLARKADELLRYEGLSVKEAARELGFCSQFYLSKVFKKEFGFAPSNCTSHRKPSS